MKKIVTLILLFSLSSIFLSACGEEEKPKYTAPKYERPSDPSNPPQNFGPKQRQKLVEKQKKKEEAEKKAETKKRIEANKVVPTVQRSATIDDSLKKVVKNEKPLVKKDLKIWLNHDKKCLTKEQSDIISCYRTSLISCNKGDKVTDIKTVIIDDSIRKADQFKVHCDKNGRIIEQKVKPKKVSKKMLEKYNLLKKKPAKPKKKAKPVKKKN